MGRLSIDFWLIVVETDVRVVSTTGASAVTVTDAVAPPTARATSKGVRPPTVTVTSLISLGAKPEAVARTV